MPVMVVRDEKGGFLCGKNMKLLGKVIVLEAEARCVQEAVIWVERVGIEEC